MKKVNDFHIMNNKLIEDRWIYLNFIKHELEVI